MSGWGVVPRPIVDLLDVFGGIAFRSSHAVHDVVFPTDRPGDAQDAFNTTVAGAHRVHLAGADARSLLSAYSHRFHKPRPNLSDLAAAQDIAPQGLIRRYNKATVAAIDELLSDTPNIATVLAAFHSLRLEDLTAVPGPVGEAAQRKAREH